MELLDSGEESLWKKLMSRLLLVSIAVMLLCRLYTRLVPHYTYHCFNSLDEVHSRTSDCVGRLFELPVESDLQRLRQHPVSSMAQLEMNMTCWLWLITGNCTW